MAFILYVSINLLSRVLFPTFLWIIAYNLLLLPNLRFSYLIKRLIFRRTLLIRKLHKRRKFRWRFHNFFHLIFKRFRIFLYSFCLLSLTMAIFLIIKLTPLIPRSPTFLLFRLIMNDFKLLDLRLLTDLILILTSKILILPIELCAILVR